MKLHAHVGVIETADETTLQEVLLIAGCESRLLARPAPNLAVLERKDADRVLLELEKRGMHPRVIR